MWIVTAIGSFSVEQADGLDLLTVRARTEEELEALRSHVSDLRPTEIVRVDGTLVPVARCPRQSFAAAMLHLVCEINYASLDQVAQSLSKSGTPDYKKAWNVLSKGHAVDFPARGAARAIPAAFGGVVVDEARGEVMLHAKKQPGGPVVCLSSQGFPEKAEDSRDAASRHVEEQLGVKARIISPLPRWYACNSSESGLYLMQVRKFERADGNSVLSPNGVPLHWATVDAARKILESKGSDIGREMRILDDVESLLVPA